MKLIPNWKDVLLKSHTAQAGTALGVLLAVQQWLPGVAAILPPPVTGTITAVLALAIPVLRIIQQPKL